MISKKFIFLTLIPEFTILRAKLKGVYALIFLIDIVFKNNLNFFLNDNIFVCSQYQKFTKRTLNYKGHDKYTLYITPLQLEIIASLSLY